jgi:hypothetical protein
MLVSSVLTRVLTLLSGVGGLWVKIKKSFILCLGGTSPQARHRRVTDVMGPFNRVPIQMKVELQELPICGPWFVVVVLSE